MNRAWMKGNVRRTGTNIGDPYHRMLSVSLASGFPPTNLSGRSRRVYDGLIRILSWLDSGYSQCHEWRPARSLEIM